MNESANPVRTGPETPMMPPDLQAIDTETVGDIFVDNPRMTARHVDVYYDDKQAIIDVNLGIGRNEVIAMIGPSGCGKSTFLRCFNRMNDAIDICRVEGNIELDGEPIYSCDLDVVHLRARSESCSRNPIHFLNPSTTTSLTAHVSTAWCGVGPRPTKLNREALRKPACGVKCEIAWTSRSPACPAANNSACVLLGR